MKKLLLLLIFLPSFLFSQDIILKGDINENMALSSKNAYLLFANVRVNPPYTLTIEKGTVIYGDYFSGGTLIIKPGAKIIAEGSVEEPIIFTSSNTKEGSTTKPSWGDWGGLVILGNAPINNPGGKEYYTGIGDLYGGNIIDDSSGMLKYIRIEYAGTSFSLSYKYNGLGLAGVGNKTIIENIQVAYSLADSFGWFGGTVNCKNLVSYKSWDDDFDFNLGYSGKLQFLFALRDPEIANLSPESNGFESDNDGSGSVNEPRTSPTVYNATIIGPIKNAQTNYNRFFRRGMHLRRSSQSSFYNTLIMGWPTGLLIDGKTTAQEAQKGNWVLKNSIIAGSRIKDLDTTKTDGSFDINSWFINNDNRTFAANDEVKLIDPFNTTNPNPFPGNDSPALTGAASPPDNGFFDTSASYVGAFKDNNWLEGWTKFDYDVATAVDEPETLQDEYILHQNYPNPFNPVTTIKYSIPITCFVNISVYDILGREITTLVNKVKHPGNYEIKFDGTKLASGVYIYRIKAGNFSDSKKLTLIK